LNRAVLFGQLRDLLLETGDVLFGQLPLSFGFILGLLHCRGRSLRVQHGFCIQVFDLAHLTGK
jgi:hypothetical protein